MSEYVVLIFAPPLLFQSVVAADNEKEARKKAKVDFEKKTNINVEEKHVLVLGTVEEVRKWLRKLTRWPSN